MAAGGIEWWAYAEVFEPDGLDASTRDRRLSRTPDAVRRVRESLLEAPAPEGAGTGAAVPSSHSYRRTA